jgi:hypothetical protein
VACASFWQVCPSRLKSFISYNRAFSSSELFKLKLKSNGINSNLSASRTYFKNANLSNPSEAV